VHRAAHIHGESNYSAMEVREDGSKGKKIMVERACSNFPVNFFPPRPSRPLP